MEKVASKLRKKELSPSLKQACHEIHGFKKALMKNFKTRSSYQGSQRVTLDQLWPKGGPRLVFHFGQVTYSISARKRWIVTWLVLPVQSNLIRWVISNFYVHGFAIATGYFGMNEKALQLANDQRTTENCLLFCNHQRMQLRSLRPGSYWNNRGFCCLWSIHRLTPGEASRWRFGRYRFREECMIHHPSRVNSTKDRYVPLSPWFCKVAKNITMLFSRWSICFNGNSVRLLP